MPNDSLFDLDELASLFQDEEKVAAVSPVPAREVAQDPVLPCPFAVLSYLIVEDSPTMRTWLRTAIADVGGKHIEMSDSYYDALYRIKSRGPFDVVLCDYILSETLDGQQLLEEVRRNHLLPGSTLWLMITGERGYEQVFSAAELAPDDYLIKPITPMVLLERVGRAWDRHKALKPATDLYDKDDFEGAIAACQAGMVQRRRHALSFERLIGDCLMRLQHYREAFDHYERLLIDRPALPWAKLGKAAAFFHLDRHDESAEILNELMMSTPDFIHAHDLMARVHEKKGDLEATKDILKAVLQKNPKALRRHREVVRVALATDDPDTAIEAYALMHQHGKGSSFLSPGDFCAYANMLMKSDSRASAGRLDALACNLRDFHHDSKAFSFSEKMVKFATAKCSGNEVASAEAYRQMQASLAAMVHKGEALDNEEALAMLEVAIEMKDESTVVGLAQTLFMDYVGNDSMCGRINRLMNVGGLGEKAGELATMAAERLRQMNLAAVNLAKQGRMLEAVEEFAQLADANRNISVSLNAATAILKYFEDASARHQKVDETVRRRLLNKLESYINFVRDRDPANKRLEKVAEAAKLIGN